MSADVLQDGVVGLGGLDYHFAFVVFAAPGASGDLLEHVEGAFGGAVVGIGEDAVGVEDADDAYSAEVEAFGDHLGADKDVRLAFGECGDDVVVGIAAPGGVKVESSYTGIGEGLGDGLLEALGAVAEDVDGVLAAVGAEGGALEGVAAIVAVEGVGVLMVDEGDVAVAATGCPAAGAAGDVRGEAAAVAEEDGLAAGAEGGEDGGVEEGRS